jgi:hypothetical protein
LERGGVRLALDKLEGKETLKSIDVMIPNHKQFIEAINEKKQVCLRFYSKADSGVIDLVCAPMDYGPGAGNQDGVNRYWLWDYTSNNGSHTLNLLPEQVLDLRALGTLFDPAQFGVPPAAWSIPRDWKLPAGASPVAPAAGPTQTEKTPSSSAASQLANN